MGQYWYPVNLDKKEFIHPHRLGAGLKLIEQLTAVGPGVGAALVLLCAAMPESRGGGDLSLREDVSRRTIGRWAGDRIALVGDYANDNDLPLEHHASTIYQRCLLRNHDYPDLPLEVLIPMVGEASEAGGLFTDITDDVRRVIEIEFGGTFEGLGWCKFVMGGQASREADP